MRIIARTSPRPLATIVAMIRTVERVLGPSWTTRCTSLTGRDDHGGAG
jgi:hypothetical protein